MKKLMTDWEWLSLRILILGLTVFLWSYITEINGVTEVFGDRDGLKFGKAHRFWGFRHFVYTITFGIITLVQCARIVKWIMIKDKYGGFKIKGEH